jgi:ribonuclease HII
MFLFVLSICYDTYMIVGIDEVGRGAWAGPMAVGAVILGGAKIDGLTDSKKLTKKQRERLDIEIRQKAVAIGIGWVSAKHIDEIGLSAALKLAARRALEQIRHDYREIIIDGTIALIDDPRVTLMKKADLLVPSVSAASVVAKVARDNYMRHLDGVFEGYKFGGHVGYGTAVHRAAIERLGVTPLHRLSYAPLQKYRDVRLPDTARVNSSRSTTKQIGDAAESEVEKYLTEKGHTILDRNWRTKYCEIDIVSKFGDTVYFTEVKYRKNDNQGGGLAAITTKKQQQMVFAAEFYATRHGMSSTNLRLAAADITGAPPQVIDYLELG